MSTRSISLAFVASKVAVCIAAPTSCSTEEPRSVQKNALLQTRHDDQARSLHSTAPRLALVSATRGTDFGSPNCPCIGIDNITGSTAVKLGEGVNASYSADVGAHCEAWDKGKHPACKSSGGAGPSFCKERWCFVDPCNCDIPVMPKMSLYLEDSRFQGKPIYFSYATCGGVDEWTADNKKDACVNQETEEDCSAMGDTCAWSVEGKKCGGKEAMGDCNAVDSDPLVTGSSGCQCIGFSNQTGATDLMLSGEKIAYPADVGATCGNWDQQSHPSCQVGENETMPEWCAQKWCYVDPCKCDLVKSTPPKVSLALKDASAQGKPVYYSYATCGGADMWTSANHAGACVNQKSEDACQANTKCDWSKDMGCLGKELVQACISPLDSPSDDASEGRLKPVEDQGDAQSSDASEGAADVAGGPGAAWTPKSNAKKALAWTYAYAAVVAGFIMSL